jgi:CHAD domain-containing protein
LAAHAAELDDPADTERACAAIDPILSRRLIGARSSALAALRSDRHATLVDDLVSAAIDPPVVDAAFAPCDVALMPLVARTWRRLEKAADELTLEMESVIWHEARIKAKRARYAADAVATIFGRDMQKFASALAQVTEVLGDHQDAFVAQTILREISSHQETDGVTGMALGLLHEYEAEEEILDRVRFSTLWPDVRRIARKAGME